ncbi:MAG TPA: S1 family peptidase [Candidatus Limnocylindrales bacterium]
MAIYQKNRIAVAALAVIVAVTGFANSATAGASASMSSELDDPIVLALAEEDGITPQEAADKLARQGESQQLAERLDRELGSRIAGSYLDRRTAGLIVNVNDEDTARLVSEAGATAVLVPHTSGELQEVKAWLDRIAEEGRTGAMDAYYIDVARNVVVVNSPDAEVSEQLRGFGSRVVIGDERGGIGELAAINVWQGGTHVWRWNGVNKYYCTAGFAAKNSVGTKYMITAAHCVYASANYLNIGAYKFGDRAYYGLNYDDASVKNNTPGYHIQLPNVWQWNGFSAIIKGWYTTIEGSYVCKSGMTTGWTCGYVDKTWVSGPVTFPDGASIFLFNLTRAKLCARKGDSGGPVITKPGSWWYATGTVSTSNAPNAFQCAAQPNIHFQPIAGTLFRSGLSIVTG